MGSIVEQAFYNICASVIIWLVLAPCGIFFLTALIFIVMKCIRELWKK
jgi:hypothetical protein